MTTAMRPNFSGMTKTDEVAQEGYHEGMRRLFEVPVTKLRNLGGIDANGNGPEEDAELLARTKHVRRKGERLMQLFARTGIGADQIRRWDAQRIAKFCEAGERAMEPPPPIVTPPKEPAGARLVIVP